MMMKIQASSGSYQHKVRKQKMGELGENQTHADLWIANAWSQTSRCYKNMPRMSLRLGTKALMKQR